MADPPDPIRRPRNPTWATLAFVSLLAAEWVVLRFHYEDWRASSPRITWLLQYGGMLAIGVSFLVMANRMLSGPSYRGGTAFLIWSGRVVAILSGGLVCLVNLLLILVTCGEAWREVRDGVDLDRHEVARLRGGVSDLVVYQDAGTARRGRSRFDVMVQHHAFPWQHKLLRLDGRYAEATLARDASGAKMVLLDRDDRHVTNVIDLDWK